MSTLNNSLDQFISNVVDKPHVFFSSNEKIASSALEMAKHFYDDVKKVEPIQFSPFTELLTEGFDNDQIWEEIAAQNEPFLDYAKTALKTFNKRPVAEDTSEDESVSGQSMDLDQDESQQDEDMEEFELDQDSEQDQDEEEEPFRDLDEENDDLEEEEEETKEEKPSKKTHLRNTSKKTSEVDDEFFNLDEFNKWTEEQEELDMMSDREDQDDEFDFDKDLDAEEDSEDEDMDDTNAAAELLYDDFYEKPKKSKPYTPQKKVQFEEEEEEEQEQEQEQDEQNDEEEEDNALEGSVRDLFANDDSEAEENEEKSAFQKQQEHLQAQIEEFEDENIQDKHWTLRGEANASARPVNSLLEEDLEFEHANKPVPVITQETTNTLEEIIKKRILDNMFDDVERKVDPTLKPFVPSKRVELSDEKSKKSLAEMYEDDYVSKQTGEAQKDVRDEALEKEHQEITDMFQTLCHKLDALSNFHYTPKAPKPEMAIVSNSAAISMEEVTPVNVSEATLLAPEEVYDKKRGDVKAASEMDQDERKRLRAQKKKLKRKEREMKERELKVMKKYNPHMGEKQSKKKAVKELLGQKNVTVIGKDGQKKSTSKAVTSASLF
ncbi:U3 small nucleolar ribonucleoprotein complex, subunit Mpp10 [Gilbertella persicaria]|uniref:U3 small nucleolar ribonucleoprotein complex, subunit Mpp10 n=1 Tax=Gilbertella persicaria TaxID=101096 RepID=UPI00222090A7|nr:U3 small nucleolar ribonucleoprotein complex, subunit Mpp10 [Gilbertella persicaria]KAI8047676.1 U3 small nucleolar ribonucleoprotein complex, subunit Mpp10 [Gilbertella persicaria]